MANGSRLSFFSSIRLSGGLGQARQEAFAHQRALPIPPIGIEAVANHRLAVAHHIGDDGDHRTGHLREVDIGVGDRRGD
jgi:hypothetical protein